MERQWYIDKIKRLIKANNGYHESLIKSLSLESMSDEQLKAVSFLTTVIDLKSGTISQLFEEIENNAKVIENETDKIV